MSGRAAKPKWPWIAGISIALVVLLLALFDWNWVRGPVNSYISHKTQRQFSSSELRVKLGLAPTIRMRDVSFANAPWAQPAPMAKIGLLEFSVSLRDLFDGRILIPRVALTDADVRLERNRDGRKNWILSDPTDTSPSRLRISSLSVTRGQLQYIDYGMPFHLDVAASTFDPNARAKSGDADAAPVNRNYTTRYAFHGTYHDAKFAGDALTGDVLSFQESGVKFPIRGHLTAGTTQLDVEGTVADAAKISAIDAKIRMSGQTLANLYPFLLLPLPASPPYRIEGHLTQNGNRYGLDDLRGQIGSTDVKGSGAYVNQEPRPLLQAKLTSDLLNLDDLGPLIGVTTKSAPGSAPPTQAETNTRPAAKSKERQTSGERVLPAGTQGGERLLPSGALEGGRIKAIDADAELTAKRVKAPESLDVSNVRAVLHLKDAMLKLDPFDVDFAGGRILSSIDLDARQPTLAARTNVRLQQLKLAELLPKSPRIAKSEGLIDGRIVLSGTGNSIAAVAAKSEGQVMATISHGEISNLLDAAAGLNGGKVIALLAGGDKEIPVRCGATSFAVHQGQGRSTLMVVDTAQTRIDGAGGFDLDQERFDITIAPKPKRPSILSLRTPVRLYGTFRKPEFELDKKGLALRGGAALVLGAVAPLAALVPLIESGPGGDVDCARLTEVALGNDTKKDVSNKTTRASPK